MYRNIAAAPLPFDEEPQGSAREGIRDFVRYAAARPELFRFMLEEGKSDDGRMQWLVDTHLRPIYELFPKAGPAAEGPLRAHMQYVLVGAGSVIFAVAPEVRRLTGLDPSTSEAIETHAELVARLLVP